MKCYNKTVALSVKKLQLEEFLETHTPTKIHLKAARIEPSSASEFQDEAINLDDWPILLFLKGIGFDTVSFYSNSQSALERWTARLSQYELIFIADPENLAVEECIWNEKDDTGNLLIECHLPTPSPHQQQKKQRVDITPGGHVPPLEAPLGIDDDAALRFVDEIEKQTPQETLLRTHLILREFESDAKHKDPFVWASLIADIIAIALESRWVEKAVQIAKDFDQSLKLVWTKSERALRLFSAYDPKPSELRNWSEVFQSCSSVDLVWYLDSQLSTTAGPQILKLMNYRAQTEPELLIEICFQEKPNVQRILLPWLIAHWKLKHYPNVFHHLKTSLEQNESEEIVQLWIVAALRSSAEHSFQDFLQLIPKRKWFCVLDKSKLVFQKLLLKVFTENPSHDVLPFMKKAKHLFSGEIADQAEKLLRNLKERS